MPKETTTEYKGALVRRLSKWLPRSALIREMKAAAGEVGGGSKVYIGPPEPIKLDSDEYPEEETTFGNLLQSRIHKAYTCISDDVYGFGVLNTEERIKVGSKIGDLLSELAASLPEELMERKVSGRIASKVMLSKRLRQLFSQIGGKSAIAKKLIACYPPHRVYVEAFAGGAACYFRKEPSQVEVLSDLSEDATFMYSMIQRLSDQDIANLQQRNWMVDRAMFVSLRELYRAGHYANELDHLYTVLYLRHAVFGSGDPSKSVDVSRLGKYLTIQNDLPDIRARLANTKIVRADARQVIQTFDGPDTFFYLDPPYPGGTSQRKDYAYGGEFSIEDLQALLKQLQTIKGKFMMSIPAIVYDYIKDFGFQVEYIDTPVLAGRSRVASRELVVLNYTPPVRPQDVAPEPVAPQEIQQSELQTELIVKSEEKKLAWIVVMKPDFVDHEGHWAAAEDIERFCHAYMKKGCPVWLEHQVDISDRVDVVENYVLLEDLILGNRSFVKGTWIIVVHCKDEKIWNYIKEKQAGASIRGMGEVVPASPDIRKATRA